jgi:hypothetical protein
MHLARRFLIPALPGLLLAFSLTTSAQWDKKTYEQWSEKDAKKVLTDSPWARTWTYTSPIEQFRGPVTGQQGVSGRTTDRPPNATHVHFRVRFFSAKPVREAFARLIELRQKEVSDEMAGMLKNLVTGEFGEHIVIVVTAESNEVGANVQQANGLLRSKGPADLKTDTYLEIKGGKRVFLQDYHKPQNDGFGARFIFPRLVDGQPFITPESQEIHFRSELNDNYKIDLRFKIKDMTYQGKLEY